MKTQLILLLIALLVLPASAVLAQGDPNRHEIQLPDGTVIILSGGWEYENQDGVYHFFKGEDIYLNVWMPETVTSLYGDVAATAPELLAYVCSDLLGQSVGETDMEAEESGISYSYEDAAGKGKIAALDWDEGLLLYHFYTPSSRYVATERGVEGILKQLGSPRQASAAPAPQQETDQQQESAPQQPAASGRPAANCTVTTDKAYGAELRLGPGSNRGVYASLMPANGPVKAIGQTTLDDGSQWWRIEENYDEVNELWVADKDVITSGDCAAIGQASAPPIVAPAPGYAPQQPTAIPPSNNDQGSSAPAPTAAPADTSLVPASGAWAIAVAPQVALSCLNGQTVTMPTTDFISDIPLSTTFQIRVLNGGASLRVTEGAYTLIFNRVGAGYYTYNQPTDPDMYVVWGIHVNSSQNIWGDIVLGIFNPECSGTISLSFQYQG